MCFVEVREALYRRIVSFEVSNRRSLGYTAKVHSEEIYPILARPQFVIEAHRDLVRSEAAGLNP